MILGLIDEAVVAGARQRIACEAIGLDARTVQRWKTKGVGADGRAGPKRTPKCKLSKKERNKILKIAAMPQYRNLSPRQIVPLLADKGRYVGSESTFYRILHEEKQIQHRERSRKPQKRHRPDEQIAWGPNCVWSWDITYLKSPVRGAFYYLYLIVDVWSRKIVGFAVHQTEDGSYAEALIREACAREGVERDELVLHSDNGSPMKAATMLAALQDLGVAASFSRPRVSDDNPYSEALFRTLKYCPAYPRKPFQSPEAALQWVNEFVDWYNTEHRHSGIKFVTPEQRHKGADKELLRKRDEVYAAAKLKNPERWSGKTRDWSPIESVALNPEPASIEAA